MPPIILRIESPLGRSRITISPVDSVADLKREIAHRFNFGCKGSNVIISTESEGSLTDDSSSLRSCNLKNGDIIQANITNITNDGSSKHGSPDDGGSKKQQHHSTSNFDLSGRTMVASLEGGMGRFLSAGNIVPLAPTIEGRRQQRLQSQTSTLAAKVGAQHFTEPTPFSSSIKGGVCYESWMDYVQARTNPTTGKISTTLDLERELCSTLLRRRGTNVLPPTVTVQQQTYRHVDHIVLHNQLELKRFAACWLDNHVQRCGFLIGKYIEYTTSTARTTSSNNRERSTSTSVVVEAVYEPPQLSDIAGVQLSSDSGEEDEMQDVVRIAKSLGMQVVGFIFTHAAREETMTAEEVRFAARLQEQHCYLDKHGSGMKTSRFVTLTLTRNTRGEIVPRGFMASDTCVVLERNQMLDSDKSDQEKSEQQHNLQENVMYLRAPKPGRVLPIIVAHGAQTSAKSSKNEQMPTQKQRQSFTTSLLLVELEVTNDLPPSSLLTTKKKLQIGYEVENRVLARQSAQQFVRAYLKQALAKSPIPALESLLYDFHLMLQLPAVFGFELIDQILVDLKHGRRLSSYIRSIVNAFIRS